MERLRSAMLVVGACASACASACAGVSAEAPLLIAPGQSREATVAALQHHEFCRPKHPPAALETYPRCDRPGSEDGDAWVQAEYRDNQLIELRRFERYASPAVASNRWNQLVAAYAERAPITEAARAAYRAKRKLPAGVKRWVAVQWKDAICAVSLLTPESDEAPALLENVLR